MRKNGMGRELRKESIACRPRSLYFDDNKEVCKSHRASRALYNKYEATIIQLEDKRIPSTIFPTSLYTLLLATAVYSLFTSIAVEMSGFHFTVVALFLIITSSSAL